MALVKKQRGGGAVKKVRSTKDDESTEKFELPTTRSEPVDNLAAYVWLIFGVKKIGKTSLTAQMGKAIHLLTEPGGKALRLYPQPIDDWRTFKQVVRALKRNTQYDTVVVDIADWLYPMAEDFICEKLVIPDLSAEDWGKGWREHRKEFEREIKALLNCGKGVVFISHAQ